MYNFSDKPPKLKRNDVLAIISSGGTLAGTNLCGVDLHGIDFCKISLSDVNFYQGNLSCANLSHCDMSRAYLAGVNVRKADFSYSLLTAIIASCIEGKGANFHKANLTRALFDGAILTQANLSEVIAAGYGEHSEDDPHPDTYTSFLDANLTGADLSRSDMQGVWLAQARLVGANLTGTNLKAASLYRANLTDADLTNADLQKADLTGCRLAGAILKRANFTGATLDTYPDWSGAIMPDGSIHT
jgi:uncharacterized protein YjbI with pentapeptide repeats